jgi:hypothetical protein
MSDLLGFDYSEFDCPGMPGSGKANMQQGFLVRIQYARLLYNRPVKILSGWRSPEHNTAVGGVEDSSHPKGWASDTFVKGLTLYLDWMCACYAAGFRRFGFMSQSMHIDCDPDKKIGTWGYEKDPNLFMNAHYASLDAIRAEYLKSRYFNL